MESISIDLCKKNRLKAMIDLGDLPHVRRSFKGWLVMVQKNPTNELFPNSLPDYPVADELIRSLTSVFGTPAITEKNLLVWVIR